MAKWEALLARYGALLDSAFWVDDAPLDAKATPFTTQAQRAYGAFGAAAPGILDAACVARFADAPWKCMFGQYAVAAVTEDFLLHTYQYDSFQLSGDVGHEPATPAEIAYAGAFRALVNKSQVADVVAPAARGTAVHSPACYHHCNTMGPTFSTAHTGGETLEQAVVAWFFHARQKYTIESCTGWKCGTECPA